MIVRDVLAGSLALGAIAVALWTCFVQVDNHERARALAREQRQWEMLEAANAQASARVYAHVPGVPNHDLDVTLREVSKRLRAERAAKKVQM